MSNKLRVTDEALLRWQLEVQQIAFVPHHDEYCWAFSLIKAGASQIRTPKEYGFEVDLAFRGLTLLELREEIDIEFFTLSQAHYDRYMRTADLFSATDN